MNTIFTDGMRFVDEFGRERIFHGINVCDKGRKVTSAAASSRIRIGITTVNSSLIPLISIIGATPIGHILTVCLTQSCPYAS